MGNSVRSMRLRVRTLLLGRSKFNQCSIKDEKKLKEFQETLSEDFEAIRRQAVIQQLYKDVKID